MTSLPEENTKQAHSSYQQQKLELQKQGLELERVRLAIGFAKYGFAGTLTAAVLCMILLFALALLEAFTPFKLGPWGYVGLAFLCLIGVIAFGYFSLWELPRVLARFMKFAEFGIDPDAKKLPPKPNREDQVTGGAAP